MSLRTCGVLLALATAPAACGRDQASPAPTVHRVSTPASGPCPFAIQGRLWAHELFPACSPPPFDTEGIACIGGCPMPCSETIQGSVFGSSWRYTFTWNDGRLATADGIATESATDSNGKLQTRHEQCEYDHGRIARCDALGGHVEVHRDARGRIVEVVEGDKTLAVTYDPAGDVVALAGRDGYVHSRLQYDGTHRLIAEEELRRDGTTRLTSRYVYDARGYYVHGDIGDLERRYDATTGLLVETVEHVAASHGIATERVTITYDDRERPIRIVGVTTPDNVEAERAKDFGLIDRDEHEYSYDCPK